MDSEQTEEINQEACKMKEYVEKCSRYTSRFVSLGIGTLFHPLQCTKILTQLGHEPMALERGKAYIIFGSDVYFLPNAFQYIRHIKQNHGWPGIFTGVGSSICCNVAGFCGSMFTLDYLNHKYPDEVIPKEVMKQETNGQAYSRFIKKLSKQTVSKTVGIILARPFQVVVIRKVAQLVGGEEIYITTFGSIKTIFGEEGVRGVFSGLVPQLVGELMILWVSSSLLFAFDRYWSQHFGDDEEKHENEDSLAKLDRQVQNTWKSLFQHLIPYVVNGVFYPFSLVSTIMTVNGTALKVGKWPYIPIFLHWQDCWDYVAKENQLKRGSRIFLRAYDGPVDFKSGQVFARTSNKLLEKR